jgi:hypothetical protein
LHAPERQDTNKRDSKRGKKPKITRNPVHVCMQRTRTRPEREEKKRKEEEKQAGRKCKNLHGS